MAYRCCFVFVYSITAVECPSLETPDNAVKTGYGCSEHTSSYGTSCFFNCMLGYEASGGSTRRICQANKQWSGTQLQCKGNERNEGKKCTCSCYFLFLAIFLAIFLITMFCYADLFVFHYLIAVTCPTITIKSEGLSINPPTCADSSAALGYATECRFTCKRGYQLQGPGLKTCAQNKNWVPIGNPSCRGRFSLKCKPLSPLPPPHPPPPPRGWLEKAAEKAAATLG